MNISCYKLVNLAAVIRIIFISTILITLGCALYGQAGNPFSIIRSNDSTVVEEVSTPAPAVTEEVSTKLEGTNPFSVSHIPIRKNQYEEIERLAISNRTVEENISLSYFPLWILIGSLCLLAFLLFNRKDHLTLLIRSVLNDNFMKMSNYENDGGRSVSYISGYVIFLLNVALCIYLFITKQYEIDQSFLYLIIFGGVSLFFVGKHVVNSLFSWIFHVTKESKLYDFTIITIYNLLSVVFLTINILLVFGPKSWVQPLSIVVILFFIIALISRYYKGIKIGQSLLNNHFVHFFLYFCAFEFSPWIILYSSVRDLI